VVMARNDDDAYESVCSATPADVELVMIGGDVAYGRRDWVGDAGAVHAAGETYAVWLSACA